MQRNQTKASEPLILFNYTRYAWAIILVWSALLGILLSIGIGQERRLIARQAKAEAKGAIDKDAAYRNWAARHGGVYVPVTEETRPNQYLTGVPERDISTPSGRRLTLISPPHMTRQVHEMAAGGYGPRGHITSLNPLRPENKPDPWEAAALKSFSRDVTEYSGTVDMDGQPYFRLMRALIAEKDCLKCHAVQGYKEGDVRGGISVSIPYGPHLSIMRGHLRYLVASYGLIWVLGLLGIGISVQRLRRRIAELAQARRLLRENELIFLEFMEHSPIYVFFNDENRRILSLSRNHEVLLGKPLNELLGKRMDEVFPPEFARSTLAGDMQALKEGREVVSEEQLNGRTYKTYKVPINLEGKPRHLAGYAIDITEQKQAEENMARMNERLRLAARAGRLGIWDWDVPGDRLCWDERMYELYGLQKENFTGAYESWLELIHPGDRARCDAEIQQALRAEKKYETEFRVVRPDGAIRRIKALADIYRGADGNPKRLIGVNFDITEHGRAAGRPGEQNP